MKENNSNESKLARTGVPGLDEILHGGLTRGSIHLLEGESGTGKTMLSLRFSLEGLRLGEPVLYFAFSENRDDLQEIARVHKWDINKLEILEAGFVEEQPSSMFHHSEVELGREIQNFKEAVDRIQPKRLIIDSLSEFRILSQSTLHYRRAMMDLKRFLISKGCTVLLVDEPRDGDNHRSLVDGALILESHAPDYGTDRRRLRILKLRGRSYLGGYHDFIIRTGGLEVFPRLVAAEHRKGKDAKILKSGLKRLDALLGGGIRSGSSVLLVGPTGTGKSSIATLYASSAMKRGEKVLFFTFDELPGFTLNRAKWLNIDLQTGLENGLLHLQQVDPAELLPGQFAHIIRQRVKEGKVRMVVIDSLNGYLHSMPDEKYMISQLHEMLTYLSQQGVATFLIMGQSGVGSSWRTPVDTSYLTDSAIIFRFFELEGEIHRAIVAIKQRSGPHEHGIWELRFERDGIKIGDKLKQIHGVLFSNLINTSHLDFLKNGENGR